MFLSDWTCLILTRLAVVLKVNLASVQHFGKIEFLLSASWQFHVLCELLLNVLLNDRWLFALVSLSSSYVTGRSSAWSWCHRCERFDTVDVAKGFGTDTNGLFTLM